MQIKLASSHVRNLRLEQVENPKDEDSEFDFNFKVAFDSSKKREFFLGFNIEIRNPKEFNLDIEHLFTFTTSEDIDKDFMSSHFPIINAPAIAFPFLRVFVSNITLNAGYLPLILPSLNFTLVPKPLIYIDGEIQETSSNNNTLS